MRHLYQTRQAQPQAGKAEALRQAQLSLLAGATTEVSSDAASHNERGARAAGGGRNARDLQVRVDMGSPRYFWAPFILIGNWR